MSESVRILVVKTSSLGDVVHALPAVSDVLRARPGSQIDWVVEEAFAGIPAMHPGVGRVIPSAIRRWRRAWWTAETWSEIARFRRALAAARYDIAIDLQGLLKSAWIIRNVSAVRHGYAWGSARESLATLAYHAHHQVDWGQHAIARNRKLAAAAVGYAVDGEVDYGLSAPLATAMSSDYIVALHSTSRPDKLWPEANWREAIGRWSARGLRIVLPWGTLPERARSDRLASGFPGATVPEAMDMSTLAALFGDARAVVGVDTGLVHLAVASGAPTLAIFGPTDPELTGVLAQRAPALNVAGIGSGAMPDVARVDQALAALLS